MKRRPRAGGGPIRARRRKTPEPKRRTTPKGAPRSQSLPSSENTEVARLTRELDEARKQWIATSKVLQVISSSTFDLQAVLDTLAESAARLCEAEAAAIWRPDGATLKLAANFGGSREWIAFAQQNPVTPDRGTISGRVILEGKVVHVRDVQVDPEFTGVGYYVRGNYRSGLGVPLKSKGETMGVFVLVRSEVREFTEKQIELVTTFADQAVIAIESVRLFEAEQQRTADLTEALEQQTATSEVLQVISSTPGDLEPVFAAMLEKAVRICDAKFGAVYRCEGGALRLVTMHNAPPELAALGRNAPFRPSPKHYLGRMIASKTTIQVADLTAEQGYIERRPEYVAAVELGGVRTYVAAPMLKNDELIGLFLMGRLEVRPFTDKQFELVKNFANQAVIESRTRDCSTNCDSAPTTSASAQLTLLRRWSSRRQHRRCCALSQALPVICSRCSMRCWRTRRGCARRVTAQCGYARKANCASSPCTGNCPKSIWSNGGRRLCPSILTFL
jgi:GAF domain-containing protein